MAIDINYNGNNIASLGKIKTAVIECAGKKMVDDLTIVVTEEGGGECSGTHIVEVEELSTENIDTTVLYKCGDSYHQYVESAFRDIIAAEDGEYMSLIEFYSMYLCDNIELYQIKTMPTTEEELANIIVSDLEGWTILAFYYIEDHGDVFIYDGSAWNSLGATGVVGDVSEITEDGMYILGGIIHSEYIVPSGDVVITENSTVDVTYKKSVTVDVPLPSGDIEITRNGTYDVTSYVNVNVNVPATYIAQTIADLPSDAPAGSLAFVLGGE